MVRSRSHILIVLLLIFCSISLAVFTVVIQVRDLGRPYLTTQQWQRHRAVLEGRSGSPWQYRILSEYLAAGAVQICRALQLPTPVETAFMGLRMVQNALIFLLAAFYYQALGVRLYHILLGMSLLAWSMSQALYNSDLQFSTYGDVGFYLLAAWLIVQKHYGWILPVTLLAALNRETSGLIPMLLATAAWFPLTPRSEQRRMLLLAGLACCLYGVVFGGVRLAFGARPVQIIPSGARPGWELLWFNLRNYLTWFQLFATYGILPALALSAYRRWPLIVRRFFWTLIPVWVGIHFFMSAVAETRLFLVPYALVILPAVLFGLSRNDRK